ncbi:hypothetical protein ACERII_05515 [Evansella sp. AB-rgal1]|uniref:hypothetical protein n=1 Tax=Evansella sp. AB-rgal1 TaxID=3242696 RepID=UPI00359E1437
MFDNKEIAHWIRAYDGTTYPSGIYKDLVICGQDHPRKIELMGAWKTGSLRVAPTGNVYIDSEGNGYSYTDRWKSTTPVGYEVWKDISVYQNEIKHTIPDHFPSKKPVVILELQDRKGFGFIWALFAVHCFYPTIYPLYDQHVYRAFIYITSEGKENPRLAPNNWDEYTRYTKFFQELLEKVDFSYWKLDKALWAYGKHLKGLTPTKSDPTDRDNKADWVSSNTLGSKEKQFFWKFDSKDQTLSIKRTFTNGSVVEKVIQKDSLDQMHSFVWKNEWVDLANNVEKLSTKTEKVGLGWFLHEHLHWPVVDAQLASHLAAIFTRAEIWEYNGLKRGMKFRSYSESWEDKLSNYYSSLFLRT